MTENETFSTWALALPSTTCAEEEILALEKLRETLILRHEETLRDDDDCEKDWLRKGFSEVVNPFPTKSPESCFLLQDDLNNFTCYLFERRFGWSECTTNLEEYGSGEQHNLGSRRSSGSLRIQDNSKFKAKLNELLDEYLKWYLSQSKLSDKLLKSLKYAVSKASNMPVVRNQTFVHIMDWLKLASSETGVNSNAYPLVKDLIVSGITDVWSAIRNTCVAKLSKFLDVFTLQQVEEFYSSLVKLCQGKDSSWQAKEGAVMCMTAIVCQFLLSGVTSESSEGPQYTLTFGLVKLTALPSFIMLSVHSVLFSLLAHPQLSIREHTTKALSAILSRCEFEVALLLFGEVINRLCQGTQSDALVSDSYLGIHELPHHAVFRQNFKFLKAHEAEGLLGVCLFLIKHIPPGYLLPKWPLYFSTLNLYLMHPASTVRQATSSSFKHLVAKDSSNPVFLKLVLQGLAADWKVEKDLVTANLTRSVRPQFPPGHDDSDLLESSASNPAHDSDEDGTRQALENRVQSQPSPSPPPSPDQCYVSADSLSSIETEVHGTLSSGPTTGTSSSSQRSTRISIRQVARLLAEGSPESADDLMSESWEWREGRLLAYELILKFLITNHIHYVFPTFILPTSKHPATSSSVDETLIGSLSNKEASKKQMFVRDRSKSDISADSCSTLSKSVGIINSTTSALYSSSTIKEGETGFMEKGHCVNESLQQGSESSPSPRKKTMRAMSYTEVDANTQTKQLIRQYSAATPQISPKRPFRLPKASSFALGNSLLNQTKRLDSEQWPSEELTNEVLFQCLRSPFGWSSSDSGGDISDKRLLLGLSTLEGDEVPQWTTALQLRTLSFVLSQVLLQTIECLADVRWELRRMGQQVLPLVTEVIRWFDMKPLEILWDNYLSRDHTLLCYGGCISLRYSVLHAGRLLHFLEQPPPSWKDPESCGRAALTVVAEIQRGLKKWLNQVHGILKGPCLDKLSVVAMETVMMSHICFPLEYDENVQKLSEEETVLNKILFLYMQSFPDHPLSDVLRTLPSLKSLPPFVPPSESFLCFSARASTLEQHAQQAVEFLISEVHPLLPRFLKECAVDQMVMIFPILVDFIGQFFEDSSVCRALLDGLYTILYRIEEMHMLGDEGEHLQSLVQSYLDFSFLGLSEVINTKELEFQVVREVLEMFIRVCIFVDRPTFLGFVFNSIVSRLNYEPDLVRLMSDDDGSRNQTPDLLILSNDIPTSPTDELVMTGEEEDEPEARRIMQESVALNTSHESSRGTTRLPSPEIPADQLSDWDSWEDENENQSAFTGLFSDFLREICQVYQSKSENGRSVFQEELLRSGETEQKAIANIMAFQGF